MSSSYITVAPIADSTPGFTFGRSGTCNSGTYLQVDSVPSNLSGRIFPFQTGTVSNIFVCCQTSATFTIQIQVRVGAVFTTLHTTTITAARKFAEQIVNLEFAFQDEICVRIGSGSAANVVVGLIVKGNPL